MNLVGLALRNLRRRPVRTGLSILGIALAVGARLIGVTGFAAVATVAELRRHSMVRRTRRFQPRVLLRVRVLQQQLSRAAELCVHPA